MAEQDQKIGRFHFTLLHPPPELLIDIRLSISAILSVFNKTGLLDLAKGLIKNNVRLLASGGTAKLIREAGFRVE